MQWRKSAQELIDIFEVVMPPAPAVLRKMSCEKLLKTAGARIFEPMPGHPMREYVILPASVIQDQEKLRFWVAQALEYGLTLRPKTASKSAGKSLKKSNRAGG